MKKSDLMILIKEVINETLLEYKDAWGQFPTREPEVKPSGTEINDVVGLGVAEGESDFEKHVTHRLLKLPKYRNNPGAAKKTAFQISQLAKTGDKRVTEVFKGWQQEVKRANESLGVPALDQVGDAIGNDPNDPMAKKLSDAKAKEKKSMDQIRALDAKKANREKQISSTLKGEEDHKRKAQDDLDKATKTGAQAEDAVTKKVNKI